MQTSSLLELTDRVLQSSPLIPVITIDKPQHALPLCSALVAGGLKVLEITLRTPHALQAIKDVREALPDCWVGAGTVISKDQFAAAVDAGAQFVISPGATTELLANGLNASVPFLPGVASLTEMMEGYRLGYRNFKFFPAEVAGGVAALKAFYAPFPDVRFCPTGGITRQNASAYLACPNVRAVGGSWLTPKDAVASEDWEMIRHTAATSLKGLGVSS